MAQVPPPHGSPHRQTAQLVPLLVLKDGHMGGQAEPEGYSQGRPPREQLPLTKPAIGGQQQPVAGQPAQQLLKQFGLCPRIPVKRRE